MHGTVIQAAVAVVTVAMRRMKALLHWMYQLGRFVGLVLALKDHMRNVVVLVALRQQ